MRNRKKSWSFFGVAVMILMQSLSVFASEPQKGSIQIMLEDGDEGTSKANVAFEYEKIADLIDGEYYLLRDYGEVDLNTIEYSDELDMAAQIVNKHVIPEGEVMTDQNGEAIISDLEIGVYLLRVSDKAEYENVSPVLISIPIKDEEDGEMKYDITVIPKHSPNESENHGRSEDFKNVYTGDETELVATIATGFIALAVLIVILKQSRTTLLVEK